MSCPIFYFSGEHGDSCNKLHQVYQLFFPDCSSSTLLNFTCFVLQELGGLLGIELKDADDSSSEDEIEQMKTGMFVIVAVCLSHVPKISENWKGTLFTCPCHKIYRAGAVGLSPFIYRPTFKNYDFWECVKFGAISWKFDTLPKPFN